MCHVLNWVSWRSLGLGHWRGQLNTSASGHTGWDAIRGWIWEPRFQERHRARDPASGSVSPLAISLHLCLDSLSVLGHGLLAQIACVFAKPFYGHCRPWSNALAKKGCKLPLECLVWTDRRKTMVEIPCSSWILSQSVDRAWNASSTPCLATGFSGIPWAHSHGWLRNMPLCGKAYTRAIGLCNHRSLWPSLTSIKIQNCLSGGSSGSALPASSSQSCTRELASSGNGPVIPVSASRWYQGNGLEELYCFYPGLAMDINLSKLRELLMDGEAWSVAVHAVHGITKRRTWPGDWIELRPDRVNIGDGPGHSCGYRLWPASSVHPGCFGLTE